MLKQSESVAASEAGSMTTKQKTTELGPLVYAQQQTLPARYAVGLQDVPMHTMFTVPADQRVYVFARPATDLSLYLQALVEGCLTIEGTGPDCCTMSVKESEEYL